MAKAKPKSLAAKVAAKATSIRAAAKVKAKPKAKVAKVGAAAEEKAKPSAIAKANGKAKLLKSAAKPAGQKRAEKTKVPRKARKPSFDKKTLASIKSSLLENRQRLAQQLQEIEESAFNVSQSEMSGEVGYDEDYADAGTFTFEREKEASIANNVQDLLDKIDRALEKIEEGTYGICESCGQPIEAARLKALPSAVLCLKDKAAEERR